MAWVLHGVLCDFESAGACESGRKFRLSGFWAVRGSLSTYYIYFCYLFVKIQSIFQTALGAVMCHVGRMQHAHAHTSQSGLKKLFHYKVA